MFYLASSKRVKAANNPHQLELTSWMLKESSSIEDFSFGAPSEGADESLALPQGVFCTTSDIERITSSKHAYATDMQ